MTIVVREPRPPAIDVVLEDRRRKGLDRHDEVWKGVHHVVPGPGPSHGLHDQRVAVALEPHVRRRGLVATGEFNLGVPDDFRVPDRGVHRALHTGTFASTAAMVVEIVSPGDMTYDKFGFYAEAGVDELLVVDPQANTVTLHRLRAGAYELAQRSEVLGVSATELASDILAPG